MNEGEFFPDFDIFMNVIFKIEISEGEDRVTEFTF